jgi:Holliday junction DNA helicase RuvB
MVDFLHDPSASEMDDREAEQRLRPSRFDDFAGQVKVLENLKVFVQWARQRDEAMYNELLHGPIGLG